MSMFLLHIIEDSLHRVHFDSLATRVRHLELRIRSSKWHALDWQKRYQKEEYNGIYILQRELYLNDEVSWYLEEAKEHPLTNEEHQQLRDWEAELDELDLVWLRHQRVLSQLLREKPRGLFMKRWEMKRQDPNKQWTRESYQCLDKGGCCERNCGCCARPMVTHRLPELYVYVHCTEACGCCIRFQEEEEARRSTHPREGFKQTVPVSVREDTTSDSELST
ncbi:hypothetical protein PVAR5_7469 [Paecilomyces variotii No. 5]|uniref:Uncharacterized protein n=1 Tax=Byssochlamys spectabilis (strain No. 5 / NBRC 109023) TaxID=1356009 RepID=V5G2Y3_BYSSN|nr:hypothetical protein PVAR5_7469 [Paecilomyces variotii No. 5]